MSNRKKNIFLLAVTAFLGISVFQGFAESCDYGAKGASENHLRAFKNNLRKYS